ncbi:MAG: sugar phosphate nucleotidyltransferase [Myxococcota bacterium]
MVLAAGFGTRLRPLTDLRPKPLVPLGDDTVLGTIVARLVEAAGVRRFVVNAHHHADQIQAALTRPPPEVDEVRVLAEPAILGTAGGVANAHPALPRDASVLVHNGDIVADLDFVALAAHHRDERPEPAATLAVRPRRDDRGRVGVDADGWVVRLRDHRVDGRPEVSTADFCGVQILGPSLRARLPATGCLVGDAYIPALRRGDRLRAAPVVRHFDDIGTPAAYLRAHLRWLEDRALPSWCHPSAVVPPGVTLDRSFVGAGARVRSLSGVIARCVIWPDTDVVAIPPPDAIVIPNHTVPVVEGVEGASVLR